MREYYEGDLSEHGHDQDDYEEFHNGEEGHDPDTDGHIHDHYRARYNAGPRERAQHNSNNNGASDVQQLHDGARGHHRDDDGYDHKKQTDALTKYEVNEDLRQFTLIISNLLFQLSRM